MEQDIIQVQQTDVIQAITRSEIDVQVATAKAYPRDINQVMNKIATLAKMDKETAQDCFYVLRRGNSVIEGLSVRMAEIIAHSWGNLRVKAETIANDGKKITAQATCFDLESNVAVCKTSDRPIVDKNGKTYSVDMQVVTSNAAQAIAFRNAVLAVIPKAITKKIVNEVKQVAFGNGLDVETSRQNLVLYFGKLGVSEDMLLEYLQVKKRDDIDNEKIFELRGLRTAIEEGSTTVQECFIKPVEERRMAEAARKKAEEIKAKAAKAQKRQEQKDAPKPATTPTTEVAVDAETGELFPETEQCGKGGEQ